MTDIPGLSHSARVTNMQTALSTSSADADPLIFPVFEEVVGTNGVKINEARLYKVFKMFQAGKTGRII